VLLSGSGDNNLLSGAAGVSLSIGSSQWVHGRGDIQLPVVNQGIIEADIPGKQLRITGKTQNTGTLRALAGSTLLLASDLDNQGKLEADGGIVELDGSINLGATGTLASTGSGTIRLGRHLQAEPGNQNASTSSARLILDGGGIPTPDLSKDAYFVEAEDFNFDRGQHLAEADAMPYRGGAYQGRGGRDRIDYHQTDNRTDSDLYRVGEGPAVNVNIYSIGDLYRGTYDATNSYKVGWNDPGDWFNYTRVFPILAEPRSLFARLSSAGNPNAIQVDEVTGDVNTTSQTLSKLGEARGPASGDYNRFAFVPLRDAASNQVELVWTGQKTFRVTILDGGNEDLNYFVFVPASSSGPAQLVEVMGQDLGPSAAGFAGNSAMGSMTLSANSQVRLVDLVNNSPGNTPEALYVDTVVVPAGATLDLNGLQLYAQDVQIAGTILGGTVQRVSPQAPALSIRALDQAVAISWPTAAGGFTLEVTSILATPTQWQQVADAPVVVGQNNTVTQSTADGPRFYRLHGQ